ncbi:MAG: hypothetical protein PHP98_00660 [Kiritimatiellae bacterium]|nr:hypothetical protein [Kiritimatiellia bacterium]
MSRNRRRLFLTKFAPHGEGSINNIGLRAEPALDRGRLKSPEISTNVLAVLDRHQRGFVPNAPAEFGIVGKGGSIVWKRPGKPEYNMIGWDLSKKSKNAQNDQTVKTHKSIDFID